MNHCKYSLEQSFRIMYVHMFRFVSFVLCLVSYVFRGYVSFGIMSFGIKSHSGLCRLGFSLGIMSCLELCHLRYRYRNSFVTMSFGILSVHHKNDLNMFRSERI